MRYCPSFGRRFLPGKASKYIRHAEDAIRPGDLVVICCRVSWHTQNRNGNLRDQEANLREKLRLLVATVIAVFYYVGSGFHLDWLVTAPRTRPCTTSLGVFSPTGARESAVDFAKKHGAKINAESTDRIVRHPDYDSKSYPDAQARESELVELRWLKNGVPFTTDLHPDASPEEVRSYQRKRGQWAKRRKGGRPRKAKPGYKKERRLRIQPEVYRLSLDGVPIREIARIVNLPESTVRAWVRRFVAVGNTENPNHPRKHGDLPHLRRRGHPAKPLVTSSSN
jgi:hypothetical protein